MRPARGSRDGGGRYSREVNITVDEFLLFCDRTIDALARTVAELGDERVNERPDLPGANSPSGLVTHALGACRWWTAHIVCGHESDRDRAGEFHAVASTAELVRACEDTKAALHGLRAELETATELANEAHTQTPLGRPWTVGAALLHAYEELAQHLGHLEVTADLLAASSASAERH